MEQWTYTHAAEDKLVLPFRKQFVISLPYKAELVHTFLIIQQLCFQDIVLYTRRHAQYVLFIIQQQQQHTRTN